VLGNPLISLDHNTGTGGNGAKAEQRSANSKAAKASSQFAADTMMAVAMTPAYQAAYNNPISLNIGGKDVEMSQGDLHKQFKTRETQLKQRIAKGQPANMSDAQWQALQDHYANVQVLVKDLDPEAGIAPEDVGDRITSVFKDQNDIDRMIEESLVQTSSVSIGELNKVQMAPVKSLADEVLPIDKVVSQKVPLLNNAFTMSTDPNQQTLKADTEDSVKIQQDNNTPDKFVNNSASNNDFTSAFT
jgi:hypothetical protein